jgi:hypothetical protein
MGVQRQTAQRGFLLPPGPPGKVARPSCSASESVHACGALPRPGPGGKCVGARRRRVAAMPTHAFSCVWRPARSTLRPRALQLRPVQATTSPTSSVLFPWWFMTRI